MNIVSFSGGKDSTAMLLMMLEKGIPVDRIICVDTTKEFPQMYDHIQKVQAMIYPLKIEIVKIDFDYWFGEHITKKKNVGYGWPFWRVRWCTGLKQRAILATLSDNKYNPRKENKKYKIPSDIVEFHGIAFNESVRAINNKGRNIQYPLVEWGVTEKQTLEYCYGIGLNWGGLYEKFHRVSCWCCPFFRIGGLRVLHNDFPELWSELECMDKKTFRPFKRNYTIQDLSEKFANENL
jgi:3'-phosphoadenosine 5'-phosphosulfate sulfotransferase (PAPS reductase)/FAD synthetase